ncbi:FAD-dependent monooxygenase [Mesorhizobium sp. M0203]
MTNTTVLVVGGGLNGLTAAALLAHNDIACVLVERHPDTSIQYKFAGISPRSMEIFRSLGLEEEIRTNRTGDQQAGAIARARNLADPEIQWGGPAWPDASALSPTQPATCDQHVLEPILRRYAERNGADVRFSTELVTFDQDETVVRAEIRDIATCAKEVISADYLIVADGANGSPRERLEISRSGAGGLQHWMNVVFDTDMPPTIGGKRFTSCFVTDLNGTFTPREGGRWLLALQCFPEKGEKPQNFDEAKCRELIIRGAGRSDITTRLVDARSWEVAALTARQFRRGRAFLVGDAAHVMPPTGAFGGNSGIHDAITLPGSLRW